jgi:large subunit ribosomal protein L3
MLKTILGTKEKMSQAFIEDTRIPVTWVKAGPCVVTQIKTQEHDGYMAVQLGFGTRKNKNLTKPLQGHLKKVLQEDKKAPRYLKEVRVEKEEGVVGDIVKVSDIFKAGDVVSVTSTSKGKGFAGVIKRWHFSGGPKTHGQSDRLRAPGSIGQGTTPGRVYKGKHMAGRMGGEQITIKNLRVVAVDPEKNMLSLSGPVPGGKGTLLVIKKIASGSLEELVEEAPEVQIQEEPAEEVKEESKEQEKTEEKKEE